MAKGAPRDANEPTQRLEIEVTTQDFISLGKILDSEFSLSTKDEEIQRKQGVRSIRAIRANTGLIVKWIEETVSRETKKAEKTHKAKMKALMESMKDQLIAEGWTPPKDA